jgi:hypothetical protein
MKACCNRERRGTNCGRASCGGRCIISWTLPVSVFSVSTSTEKGWSFLTAVKRATELLICVLQYAEFRCRSVDEECAHPEQNATQLLLHAIASTCRKSKRVVWDLVMDGEGLIIGRDESSLLVGLAALSSTFWHISVGGRLSVDETVVAVCLLSYRLSIYFH